MSFPRYKKLQTNGTSDASGLKVWLRNNSKAVLGTAVLAFSVLLMMVFPETEEFLQSSTLHSFYLSGKVYQASFRPADVPDPNIVLIHATREDIDQLGPYPLKRSYYALIIRQLTELNVRAIGIETFFGENFPAQSVYNELLNNEISRSGKVVLSSIIEMGAESPSVKLPQPLKEGSGIQSGYLNFDERSGIVIPLEMKAVGLRQTAFSAAVLRKAGVNEAALSGKIKVNFRTSWKRFRNYSFLEFFDLAENSQSAGQLFRGKIVLIGVSDERISRQIHSYGGSMPGLALHAFAVDNILQNKYLRDYTGSSSAVIYTLIIFLIVIIYGGSISGGRISAGSVSGGSRRPSESMLIVYLSALIVLYLSALLMFEFLCIETSVAWFILPLLLLSGFSAVLIVFERSRIGRQAKEQAEILRHQLLERERKLQELQHSMLPDKDNAALEAQIASLGEEIEKLRSRERDELPSETDQKGVSDFHGMIYRSRRMAEVAETIRKTAPEDATVLILGESGTGKELVARAMHQLNRRSVNNFVAVNCAALPETLLESELFGHVKGAFTGAGADKTGRFEQADKGTIFLDEIGETSENFQLRLLRVLQTGEFEKVGSSVTKKVDVRIIAATNKNPVQLIRENKFREDLYYRLNVIKIELPPLRERKEDIEAIANYFLDSEKEKMQFSQSVIQQLIAYEWKGNVRELQSVVKRSAIFARSAGRSMIKTGDLPEEVVNRQAYSLEAQILESLREKKFSHSSIAETARELGDVSRTIVSENFRGLIFKAYVEQGFSQDKAVEEISGGISDDKVTGKIRSKAETFLENIRSSVQESDTKDFSQLRILLSSKYKNLPQRYHRYLDEIIKKFLD